MADAKAAQRHGVNLTTLDGVVIQPADFRYTPAGRAVLHLMVEHVSRADPAAAIERLELHMPVVLLGELAERHRDITQGQYLHIEGSLNQKRWIRDGKVRWGKMELLARTVRLTDVAKAG